MYEEVWNKLQQANNWRMSSEQWRKSFYVSMLIILMIVSRHLTICIVYCCIDKIELIFLELHWTTLTFSFLFHLILS